MKRILSIALVIFMLGLSACGANTAVQTTTSSVDAQACQWIPTYVSLEDYYEYISEGIDSESFISYDMIKEFGTFDSFVDYGSQKCSDYVYGLIDNNGYYLSLHIRSSSEEMITEEDTKLINNPGQSDDLRIYSEQGYRLIEDTYYFYNFDNLVSIAWKDEDHLFLIRAGRVQSLSDYPAEKTTLLTQLLNAETAEAAVDEFNAKVAAARAEKVD